MPNILFRADAEKSIGIGDLMSLIYLSGKFQKNAWQSFFVIKDYELALEIINKRNLKNVYLLSYNATILEEINFLKKICQEENIDCLFMEITKHSLREYTSLGKPVPIKACINFDGVITQDFDVVMNWCVDYQDKLYEAYKENNIQFLLGFENIILPDYLEWKKIIKRTYPKDIRRILIAMGGIDEFDMTQKIVKVLTQRADAYEIRVVTGAGYRYQQELSKFMQHWFKNFSLKQNVDTLFEDYLWADIAFSAGGLTASELVATRTPAILISTYKHQIKRCEYYFSNKWVYYAGFHSNLNEKSIIESLDYLKENINLFRESLSKSTFRGGNEKIFKNIDSCRQARQLV